MQWRLRRNIILQSMFSGPDFIRHIDFVFNFLRWCMICRKIRILKKRLWKLVLSFFGEESETAPPSNYLPPTPWNFLCIFLFLLLLLLLPLLLLLLLWPFEWDLRQWMSSNENYILNFREKKTGKAASWEKKTRKKEQKKVKNTNRSGI